MGQLWIGDDTNNQTFTITSVNGSVLTMDNGKPTGERGGMFLA